MQIVIAGVILSYPHLWEKHHFPDQAEDKADYKADFIFPQGFDFTLMEQAITAAIAEKFPVESQDPAFRGTLRMPYKEVKDGPYAGCFHISSKGFGTRPTVLDQNVQPLLDRNLMPAGSKVNAQINVFAYPPKAGGSAGVTTTVNMVQLDTTADGVTLPSLGGEIQRPEDHFKAIPGAPAATAPFPGAAAAPMVPAGPVAAVAPVVAAPMLAAAPAPVPPPMGVAAAPPVQPGNPVAPAAPVAPAIPTAAPMPAAPVGPGVAAPGAAASPSSPGVPNPAWSQ